MPRRWTPDEEAWLRENYPTSRMPRLLDLFEERFGRRPTRQSVFQKAYKMGLAKGVCRAPDRAVRPVVWAREPEMDAWMREHDDGRGTAELSHDFSDAFGFPLSRSQINLWRSSNGRQTRRSHGGGRPLAPIGAEMRTKAGILVKVAERPTVPQSKDNWRFKHIISYEEAYGSVPEGCNVVAANGDLADCRAENLVAVPKGLMPRINSVDTPEWHDRETLEACIAYCALERGIHTAETAMPRTCGVCGRTFTPDPSRRSTRSGREIQTCPECLAKGLKSTGARKVVETRTCLVCGKSFDARYARQHRCPECVARAPKHSWQQQIKRERRSRDGEGNG